VVVLFFTALPALVNMGFFTDVTLFLAIGVGDLSNLGAAPMPMLYTT
jgi:hypothetical protein